MISQFLKKINTPEKPGVYFFLRDKEILYIGKATSIRDRTRSYFSKDLIETRGPLILDMVTQATDLKWQETDSVLEALILESNLIKKHKPKYNTKEKDNKSFNYVCITRDKLPRILVLRERVIKKSDYKNIYGPFPNGAQLKEAMKIIRRIFPYIDNDSIKKNNKEFYKQLGLTPTNFSVEYKNNIKNINLLFQGKKRSVISNLKKEMNNFAKKLDFEKANIVKKRIFALEHINDISLIKDKISSYNSNQVRIESYDIAHTSGKNMVGVMTVVVDGEIAKNEYKKFIIRTQKNSNDTGALDEVLSRRFRHLEWGLPNIVVVDGGQAQINVAQKVLNRYQLKIPIISVVKDEHHKARALIGNKELIKKYKKSILISNSEAHRFAITYHRQKRGKSFLNKKRGA